MSCSCLLLFLLLAVLAGVELVQGLGSSLSSSRLLQLRSQPQTPSPLSMQPIGGPLLRHHQQWRQRQSQQQQQQQQRSGFALQATRGGGGGGSTKLDTRIKADTATKSTFREEIEKDWRLILHDDTVHTIQQVVEILGATCPLCSGPRAYEVTLEVHMSGAGTVAVSNKKVISEYCKSLQQAGLSVSMAPDDDFESGEGEEGEE